MRSASEPAGHFRACSHLEHSQLGSLPSVVGSLAPCPGCVTLGKSLNLSVHLIYHEPNEDINGTNLIKLLTGLNEIMYNTVLNINYSKIIPIF